MRAGPCVVATDRPATEVCLHSGATTVHGQSKGCHCLQVIALYMQHIAATSNSHLRRHAAFLFRLRVGCALAQAQGGWLTERGAPCVEGCNAPDWFFLLFLCLFLASLFLLSCVLCLGFGPPLLGVLLCWRLGFQGSWCLKVASWLSTVCLVVT